jgi:hypothetical protein
MEHSSKVPLAHDVAPTIPEAPRFRRILYTSIVETRRVELAQHHNEASHESSAKGALRGNHAQSSDVAPGFDVSCSRFRMRRTQEKLDEGVS